MTCTVGRTGEKGLIRLIAGWVGPQNPPQLLKGIGDDCAVVKTGRRVLLTTDSFIEDVHFRRSWMNARDAGRKALTAGLSDIAAAGGRALAALISLELPATLKISWLKDFYSGLKAGSRQWSVALAGGNISAGDKFAAHITVLGSAPARRLGRSGARPGDVLAVTGRLGGSMAGYLCLEKKIGAGKSWAASAIRRHLRPQARLEAGRVLARFATSMIDVSDGLFNETGHLASASRVRILIFPESVPGHAAVKHVERILRLPPGVLPLVSGEEYELLATVPSSKLSAASRSLSRAGVPFRQIGQVRPGKGVEASGVGAKVCAGFDHFRS